MTQHINEPDLVVYLQADTPTLLKRIAQRGRDSEQAIEPSYLNLLNELYEAFIQRHTHCPVLIIQAEETQDLDQYYTTICDQIMAKIKETKLNDHPLSSINGSASLKQMALLKPSKPNAL